jgi:hypothetical protein
MPHAGREGRKGGRAKTEDWIYHGWNGWRRAQGAKRKAQGAGHGAQGGKRKAQGGKRGSAVALTMRFGSLMASPTANAGAHWPGAAASDVAIVTKLTRLLPVQCREKLALRQNCSLAYL